MLVKFYRSSGSFSNPLNWWRIRFGCTALDQWYWNKEKLFACWKSTMHFSDLHEPGPPTFLFCHWPAGGPWLVGVWGGPEPDLLLVKYFYNWYYTFMPSSPPLPQHKRYSSVHTGRFDLTSPAYWAVPLTTGPLQLWCMMWAGETKYYLRSRLLLTLSLSLLQAWMPVPESK